MCLVILWILEIVCMMLQIQFLLLESLDMTPSTMIRFSQIYIGDIQMQVKHYVLERYLETNDQ